ncbi:MAG TPA: DUF192 domain-containing protein [Spirochaetia bacterium]|nr:DUF192 domain-containing protein [Spirochaetia bacterium]
MYNKTTWRVALVLAGAVALLGGCRGKVEKAALSVAGQSLTVEVARTEAEREHGLMGRKDLGPRDGMIFIFDRDDHLAFWMKNTPTPLSIAFISTDGKILQIEDMQPFSESVIRSRFSARYALEMRQGAFAGLGVREGDVITFPPGFPNAGS